MENEDDRRLLDIGDSRRVHFEPLKRVTTAYVRPEIITLDSTRFRGFHIGAGQPNPGGGLAPNRDGRGDREAR